MKTISVCGGLTATVDDEDYEKVAAHSWCRCRGKHTDYAETRIQKKIVLMHRFLLGATSPEVDHIDGNGLNNCKRNLRPCTNQQNHFNAVKRLRKGGIPSSSQYKGVHWHKGNQMWAFDVHDAGHHVVKYFRSEVEAASAYNNWAITHYGEFARLNEIKGR